MLVLFKSLPKVRLVHALRGIAEILPELEDKLFPNLRFVTKGTIDGWVNSFARGSVQGTATETANTRSTAAVNAPPDVSKPAEL